MEHVVTICIDNILKAAQPLHIDVLVKQQQQQQKRRIIIVVETICRRSFR